MPATPDLSLLEALRWTRLRVALRNTRDVAAREHPLWILHSLLMFAVPPEAKDGRSRFTFRPLTDVGESIRRSTVYPLEVLFPDDDPALATACAEGLERHLANRRNNFAIKTLEPPEVRSLGDLLDAAPAWPDDLDEVCLDFQTPLAYTPANPDRPGELSARQLGRLLAHRLQHFFVLPAPVPPAVWESLQTLCHFWEFVKYPHPSNSGAGVKTIAGNRGPLYLRGAPDQLAAVRPWLLLGSEVGAGLKLGPRGHYTLQTRRGWFDPVFTESATYTAALDELQRRSDLPEDFAKQLGPEADAVTELAAQVAGGRWTPGTAQGFRAVKSTGIGERLIVQLPARDRLLHQALQIHLTPVFERLFEPQSHGYRPGRGVPTARRLIQQAWADGCTVALEADIEAFFDSVSWETLEAQLDAVLPRADRRTRAAIHALLQTPVRLNRRPVRRTRGLLQGSPISPLLANLHLDPFDEAMTRRGFRLVRYADDFVVLTRSEDEARAALEAAREVLTGLGLTLKDSKTAITPFSAGFTFLGVRFGGGLEPDGLEDAALEKTLFLRHPRAWVGVDHDALTVKEGGRLVARIPLRRVREVVLLGAGGVSARLVECCARRAIAVSFCTAAGRLQNVLWRHDRAQYVLTRAHARAHAALREPEQLACARLFVAAKIHNYLAWFRERTPAHLRPMVDSLEAAQRLLADAHTLDAIRGVEGLAAREVFRHLNDSAPEAFRSRARVPGEQPDRWNLLLDFAYSLLFQRLNALVRLRGLDPYLGFLHSPQARYESLVCDLQEPFRVRCDRFVLKLVNRGQLKPEDFTDDPLTGPDLSSRAAGVFLELFARELDTRLAGDAVTWARAIEAQVLAIERWANGQQPLQVFRARNPAAPPGADG
ncbi:MAG: CRISPR-associated endonuclease Cas1 [Verrucomicrobiales bacterium]|nr:CRISPR-associated endonuclease Cas1 [Verrucomicrobiales bacterium]